jgi:hypothetical protein
MITEIIGAIGTVVGGFFNMKQGQQLTVGKAFDVISDSNRSEEARMVAAAQIITAEINSGSWLVRNWRAITALGFFITIEGYFFGWWDPEKNVDIQIINRIFDIMEYSVLGFGGVHSIDKWIQSFTTNKTMTNIMDNVIKKKVS